MSKALSLQSIADNFIETKTEKSFKTLINRLRPGLFTYAYGFVKDKDIADEIVSQTFISIWEKIDQYNNEYNFSTWAYAIAKNEALGMLRHSNRNVSYDMYLINNSKELQNSTPVYNMETECMLPSGETLLQELYDASISAISKLKSPYNIVMYEREVNKKQLQDIAEDLGWNLSTVKTRLTKARRDVAEILHKTHPLLVKSYLLKEENE